MSDLAPDFPDLSNDDIRTLVEAIEAADDRYTKMDAMDPYVGWGERRHLLWELTRSGALETWRQPELWRELSNGLAWATSADVVALLARIDGYDTDDFHSRRLIDEWPISLDEMCCRAYHKNPDPFDIDWKEFPEPVRTGFQLVLRRFDKIAIEELSIDILDALAAQHVEQNGLPMHAYLVRDGELEEIELYGQEGPTRQFYDFIERFGSRQQWGQAVLEHTVSTDLGPPFSRTFDAWLVAETDQLADLLDKVDIQPVDRPKLYEILLERRDDSPEELVAIARKLKADSPGQPEPEICAVAAVLKWRAAGEPAPADVVDLFSFKSAGKPSKLEHFHGPNRLVEAVAYLPEAAIVEHMCKTFADDYHRAEPFAVLKAWADNPEVVDAAFGAAEAIAAREYASFAGMHPVAYGLAMAGDRLLDRVAEAYEQTDNPLLRDTYHRAIVYALAEKAKHGEPIDERWDPYLSFVDWESTETDDYHFGHYIRQPLQIIYANIPEERAEQLLIDQLEADSDRWPQALEGLEHHPSDELFDHIFDRVAREGVPTTGGNFNWLDRFLRALDKEDFPTVGRALAEADSPELHNSVKRVLGEERYASFLEEYGGESSADETAAEEVARLAEAMFDERPEMERTTVYFLERLDEAPEEAGNDPGARAASPPEPGAVNRIGGPPIGVDAESWPCREADPDEPMEHVLTLDLSTTPELRERVDAETAAVSLFVFNPDFNEAWSPHNGEAEVVPLTDEDLQRGPIDGELPAGPAEPTAFDIVAVDIPTAIFEHPFNLEPGQSDPALENLRTTVYQAPARAGGRPIWLQTDESPSDNFLMQFDEEFVPMNLGDMGVMYVFAETAFWQCH